jgi:polar amino acid transport system substrate-binding protein
MVSRPGQRAGLSVFLVACLITGAAQLAHAAPLRQVEQSGTLRLCANPAALPYSNRSSKDRLPGFQLELAEAVARKMGLSLFVHWVPALSTVRILDCDALMDSVALGRQYNREG